MNNTAEIIDHPGEKLYTIGTVSKLTGVGAITLRAWERRYGLIQPVRKESGHRLYTRKHIDQINRITALTQQGIRISQIQADMLESGMASDAGPEADKWMGYLDSMLAAIIDFDEERLEEIYNEALSFHPIGMVTGKLLTPLLVELGLRWEGGEPASVAQEHFFAFYLRNKLGARFHHRPRGNAGPLLLLAGLPGEHHEIGVMLFSLAAHDHGYRIVYLGSNMPLQELALTARRSGCDGIVLSGSVAPQDGLLSRQLPQLVSHAHCPVFLGGTTSVRCSDAIERAGALPLGTDIRTSMKRIEQAFEDLQ